MLIYAQYILQRPSLFNKRSRQSFSSIHLEVMEGYFFVIHYCLSYFSMLRLFLTTTSLPPPVWTHISSCLFKLYRFIVDCSSHQISFVSFSLFRCWSFLSDQFLPFKLQMLFWSDRLWLPYFVFFRKLFICQFCFYCHRALFYFHWAIYSPIFPIYS